jgi:hypothetical protein
VTLADDLKPLLHSLRSLPGQLGLRPHTVSIVTRVWSGDHTGEGTMTETVTPLEHDDNQPPRCRWLNDEQRALAGLVKDAVDIGPFTPGFSSGGTELAALDGRDLDTGNTLHLRITGPNHPTGALYRISRITRDRSLRYLVRAEPVE